MKVKKIVNTVVNIIFAVFVGLSMYVIITGVIATSNGVPPSVFGSSFAVVPTESMEPTIKVDDTIIFKKSNFSTVLTKIDEEDRYKPVSERTNPIIVFKKGSMFIVHRAISVVDGKIITMGDNNSSEDSGFVTIDNYLGEVTSIHSGFGLSSIIVNYRNIIFFVIAVVLVFVLTKQIIKLVKVWVAAEKEREDKIKLEEGYISLEDQKLQELQEETRKLKEELESKRKNV